MTSKLVSVGIGVLAAAAAAMSIGVGSAAADDLKPRPNRPSAGGGAEVRSGGIQGELRASEVGVARGQGETRDSMMAVPPFEPYIFGGAIADFSAGTAGSR